MRLLFLYTSQVRAVFLRGVHVTPWVIFPCLTKALRNPPYRQCSLYFSHWFKALTPIGTSSERGKHWPWLPGTWQSQFLLKCSVWSRAQRTDLVSLCIGCNLQGTVRLWQMQRRPKTSSSYLKFKNPAPFFFLNPSPANEEFCPRCWFYPLATNNSRNNALVVLCDTQSQKTLASSLFLTGIFMCSKPHPQEWRQHQLKFRWCEHEWLWKNNVFLDF